MRRLAILGASGHGKVVADAALCAGWQDIVFFDDAWPHKARVGEWIVAGGTDALLKDSHSYKGVVIAIGNNEIRKKLANTLNEAGILLTTIVHPSATVSRYAKIGRGSVIFAGAVLNPDCNVGEYCIINTNASIEHDCVLADGVHVSPNASLGGQVSIGGLTWIGIGASVKQQVTLGQCVLVGAGAAVVSNIPDNATVVGVPARITKIREG